MEIDVEIVAAATGVPADQAGGIGLVDRLLDVAALVVELAADVDVAGRGADGETGDQAAFDQLVRIVAQDVPVLAGTRLALVGVHDQIDRTAVALLRHEGPLHAGGEAGTAAAAQAGLLDQLDDPVAAEGKDVLGVVPVAPAAGGLQAEVLEAVEVREDAVFVAQHGPVSLSPARPA